MKKLKQVVVASAIVVLASFSAFAQKGTVKGNVKDKEAGEGIPFLSVYVQGQASGTMTDFDGNYTLELDAGTYELVFSSVEYGKTNKTVTVVAGETQTLDMQISTSSVEMNTIIVKTDKYSKPIEEVVSSMDIIKPNIIENKASTDVKAALEQAPGLTIVDNEPQMRAGSGYSFGAGSRVAVLVDDLPLITGDAGRPSWGFIPVENIEQIEIIKGASSVLYGSGALNGVINVRTAYPKSEPLTKVNVLAGVYNGPKNEQSKWWDSNIPYWTGVSFLHSRRFKSAPEKKLTSSLVLGGNVLYENSYVGPAPVDPDGKISAISNGWNKLLNNGTFTPAQYEDSLKTLGETKRGEYDYRGRLNFNTNFKANKVKGLAFGLNGNFSYGESGGSLLWLNNYTGLLKPYPGALTITKQTTFSIDPYISYFDQKGNKYSLNTRVFYQDNDNDNNQANKNTVYYGEFRYMKAFPGIKDFTLSTGAVGTYVVASSQLFAGNYTQSNAAVYLQLDKKFWDRLTLTAGGRWEYFNVGGDGIATETSNQPVGRLGLNVRVAKATYFRASFGQGFRFPTIAERYIETTVGGIPITSNPSLKPEKSWNLEAGVKQGLKIGKFLGYLDFAGFVQQYEDYVEFIAAQWLDPFANPFFGLAFKSVNTGKARVSGIEATFLGQGNFTDDFGINVLAGYMFARPITLTPDYAFGKKYKTDGSGEELTYLNTSTDTTDNILKYRYENLVKLDLEFNYKKASAGVSFRTYSFMKNVDAFFYDTAPLKGLYAKPYRDENNGMEYVFDFRISYKVATHSKISFVLNNALNREYSLRPLVMDPPRSYVIQYSLTL